MTLEQRLILVLGPPKVGKTTVVQKLMALCRAAYGGFFTLAEESPGGRRRSFKLVTVGGPLRGVPQPDDYFIRPSEVPDVTTVSFADLEERGVAALAEAAARAEVVVVDELGSFQLHDRAFRAIVERLVDSSCILVATGADRGSDFLDQLSRRADALVARVTSHNRCILPDQLAAHVRALILGRKDPNEPTGESAATDVR